MILEHIFFNTGLSLIAAALLYRYSPEEWQYYPWIIIASTYIPDLTAIISGGARLIGMEVPAIIMLPQKDGFHTVGALICYMLLVGILLQLLGLRFRTSALFAGIGYGAHLCADALAYSSGYALLWPFTSEKVGIGVFEPYIPVIFGLAAPLPLATGIVVLVLSLLFYIGIVHPVQTRRTQGSGKG